MAVRIEVRFRDGIEDAAGNSVRAAVESDLGIALLEVRVIEAYAIDAAIEAAQVERVAAEIFTDPLTQEHAVGGFRGLSFGWAVEVGFLPGVTDNVGSTSRTAIQDLLGIALEPGEKVYSSRVFLLDGLVGAAEVERIARHLSNPLIHRVGWKTRSAYEAEGGMGLTVPRVALEPSDRVDEVDLEIPDDELESLGREGIPEHAEKFKERRDGEKPTRVEGKSTRVEVRRGPLALDLEQLKVIRGHFRKLGRKPTDVELESLAQTWSEHCHHTIFAAKLDEIDSLYKTYIKGATARVRSMKGPRDPCLSVFSDNAGVVRFNGRWSACYKVETHNSPSALDPYGGAITGIVGVNRDPLGTGKGAQLVMNMYGFCFADPRHEGPLPTRDRAGKVPILHPKTIFEGVRKGVEDGGNKSGIPTPLGFICFDDRYMGKPLVFVGTVGMMPMTVAGEPSHLKRARPGDFIVMAGGRVGKDGIHGATFSSESLHEGSPAGAVQIGDPITQKKLGDAQLEARDMGLYSSVTDCGAGGISCSVSEMAKESGGCEVDLDRVPVKYAGLAPFEIWISESQERMTYAVPPGTLDAFLGLMRRRDAEATVIGRFTSSGKCVVLSHGKAVVDLDLAFLHEGLPRRVLASASPLAPPAVSAKVTAPAQAGAGAAGKGSEDLGAALVEMAGRLNVCSREFVVRQYDHEVQGGSVIKPLGGVHLDVHNDAVVVRPLLDSMEGLAFSVGILPWYGDLDPYGMAAACIDTAVRGVVAVGGDPDETVLLDNFCWCSSDDPLRLWQLRRAAEACHDTAIAYGAPFISGKDSMFNDFKGYGPGGDPVKISVPPTLLVSSMAKVEDVRRCVDLQAMAPGDVVYVIGGTREEMGGSEYLGMMTGREATSPGAVGTLPAVFPDVFVASYRALHRAIGKGLIASCASVGRGGLGMALARMAMAGDLGIVASLGRAGLAGGSAETVLFSESQGRLVVTVDREKREAFEMEMHSVPLHEIGEVTQAASLVLAAPGGGKAVDVPVEDLRRSYKKTLDW